MAQTTITPYRDGPYLVRGPFSIVDQEGNEIEVKRRVVALCRCGRSRSSRRSPWPLVLSTLL